MACTTWTMSRTARRSCLPEPTPQQFLSRFAVIVALIGGIYLFDITFANIDRAETKSNAASDFRLGRQSLQAGNIRQAVEKLRDASNLDRSVLAYPVVLSEAVLASGRADDAERLLEPVLARNATDGAANLARARILVKEERFAEAESYFHRAIYGLWSGDASTNRLDARFELIDLLARVGAKRELLSELLAVESDSAIGSAGRRRVGHLLNIAGSPDRAASIFREFLRSDPRDADAYAGLGESALQRGNFATARADFTAALNFLPGNSDIEARMAVADTALALDPLQRGLAGREQLHRATNIVRMTIASVRACAGGEIQPQAAAELGAAEAGLTSRPRVGVAAATIDVNLALAGDLWKLRRAKCPSDESIPEQALSLVHARLAQWRAEDRSGD